MKRAKRVMVFGAFDFLHLGHIWLLKQARRLGKELVVVIARDSTIKKLKGRAPFFNERERARLVGSLKLVDRTLLGCTGNKYQVIKKVKPDVIVLGFDQCVDENLLRKRIKEFGLRTRVVRLRAGFKPKKFKSSLLRKWVEGAWG